MKTGTQPAGNKKLGIQGVKLSNNTGKPNSVQPAGILAEGDSGKRKGAGVGGFGMGGVGVRITDTGSSGSGEGK